MYRIQLLVKDCRCSLCLRSISTFVATQHLATLHCLSSSAIQTASSALSQSPPCIVLQDPREETGWFVDCAKATAVDWLIHSSRLAVRHINIVMPHPFSTIVRANSVHEMQRRSYTQYAWQCGQQSHALQASFLSYFARKTEEALHFICSALVNSADKVRGEYGEVPSPNSYTSISCIVPCTRNLS